MMETTPQDTAHVLGFETSDDELRKLVNFSLKVASGSMQMSEAITGIMKDFDIPVNDTTKKAAGAAFLFSYGMACAQAKAEIKREMGL